MDQNMGDWEANHLVNELTRGKELATQLQMHLSAGASSSQETCEYLVQKILGSFEKGISMLSWPIPVGSPAVDQPPEKSGAPMLESPPSLAGSPRSDQDSDRELELRDASRKRKSLPRWTKQVRVNPGMGLEGPLDDGFSWRKYGQKDILAAKYPRGYYRCTHRNIQGCLATKQVQRSDNDPNVFEITYRGRHTCNQPPSNIASPTTDQTVSREQEHLVPNPNPNPTIELSPFQQNKSLISLQLGQQIDDPKTQLDRDMLSSLRSGLKVITEGLDSDKLHFASSSSATHRVKAEALNENRFIGNPFPVTEFSPPTLFHVSSVPSGTGYFSVPPQGGIGDHFGVSQNFENPNSKTEINTNSATNNTPNVGTDLAFPFGHVDDQLDPNFFGHQGFY